MSEADTQKLILSYLKRHPLVAWCGRFNSGRKGNIRFSSVDNLPDILGQLKDGKLLAIEVKNESWKGPKTPHELGQAEFLACVLDNNGVGLFATSLDDVIEVMGGTA